ncbi:MAG: type I secretion system permease/ATPase, partial [Beggiatoa sp. IS2]
MINNSTPWENTETALFDDPLLQCLVILTKIHNRPCSAEALKAGLPLVNHRFTPELFIRAAKRAQLSARLVKRELAEFSPLVLPAVLLLKDGRAGIFNQYLDKKHKKVQFILPDAGDGTLELTLKELHSNYSGYALFVRPAYPFDERTEDHSPARGPRGWFWGTVLKSWNLYVEVLVASLLINLFALASPLFVMNVYDRVVPNHAIETLWVLAIGVAIVLGFDLVMRSLRGYFIDMAGKKTDILLASRLFEQVLGTQRQAQPRSVGAFANHLHEFEAFRDFFTSATLTTFIDIPFTAVFILVIWSIHTELAIIPLAAIPLVLVISLFLQLPLRTVIQQTFRAGSQKQALLIETLTGIETLKTLRAEGLMQRRWEQLVGNLAQFSLKSRFFSALAVNLT